MTPEEFDSLIRDGDPQEAGDNTPLLSQAESRWSELASRRQTVRRRMKTLALAAAVLLVAGITWSLRVDDERPMAAGIEKEPLLEPTIDPRETAPVAIDPAPTQIAETPAKPIQKANPTDGPLEMLVGFVDGAGAVGSQSWIVATANLVRSDQRVQRQLIEIVPEMQPEERRRRAFTLVCHAAGTSRRDVLRHWLTKPQTRPDAWTQLVTESTFDQCLEMVPLANSPSERAMLSDRIAASPEDRSIDALIRLASLPEWRPVLRQSVKQLSENQIRALTIRMRGLNGNFRTAAAFVLAGVDGARVERVAGTMILQGKHRQPAYLALLARNTPESKAFLMNVASRRDLAPALVSAQVHFATMQKNLHQWIAESQGESDETDTTRQRPTARPDHYLARCDVDRRVG